VRETGRGNRVAVLSRDKTCQTYHVMEGGINDRGTVDGIVGLGIVYHSGILSV